VAVDADEVVSAALGSAKVWADPIQPGSRELARQVRQWIGRSVGDPPDLRSFRADVLFQPLGLHFVPFVEEDAEPHGLMNGALFVLVCRHLRAVDACKRVVSKGVG